MNDYISRQATIDAICNDWCGTSNADCKNPFDPATDDYYYCDGCGDVELIKALPTADVQPVRHGHWIYTPTSPLGFTCSECGKEMCRFNYCPHCGVRMDEVTQ